MVKKHIRVANKWYSVKMTVALTLLGTTSNFRPNARDPPKNTTQQHDVSVQSTLDRRPMYYSQNKNGPVESECKLNNVNPHIIRNQIHIK